MYLEWLSGKEKYVFSICRGSLVFMRCGLSIAKLQHKVKISSREKHPLCKKGHHHVHIGSYKLLERVRERKERDV